MHDRLKQLRELLGYNQTEFSKSLGLGRSTLGMMEVGKREILERHIKTICSIFNVNENWLRTGEGEMFVQSDVFSLDEYADKANLSDLEADVIKAYINLDSDIRKDIVHSLKSIFDKHSEISVAENTSTTYQTSEDDIEKELESYRLELEAEKRGQTSSASENVEKNIG